MIFYVLILALAFWIFLYLGIGIWLTWDEVNPTRRFLSTIFWMVLPLLGKWSKEYAESLEPVPFEGICKCNKRHPMDAGHKWCSICGGKIKDKLWKRG